VIDEQLWVELETINVASPGLARRRVREDSSRDIFVGVSLPGGQRVLILRVSADTKIPEVSPTKTLSLHRDSSGLEAIEIRVVLETLEMREVFTPFVVDVVDAVAGTNSDSEAVRVFADRFDHWRSLFAGNTNGLGETALRGLLGELWTIRNLLTPTVALDQSVLSWTGPDRDRRDFVFGGLGVEVKTTTSSPPASVLIQSELQLDGAPLDRLVLIALELDRVSGAGGLSVNELVAWARGNVSHAAGALEDGLNAYGYYDVHATIYDGYRFVLRSAHVYEVIDGFPRITPTDLHPGVGEVSYRLSLGACEPWKIDVDHFSSMLQESTRTD
jgi:hypothetical protein